jgi:hypothetical protein
MQARQEMPNTKTRQKEGASTSFFGDISEPSFCNCENLDIVEFPESSPVLTDWSVHGFLNVEVTAPQSSSDQTKNACDISEYSSLVSVEIPDKLQTYKCKPS